MRGPTVFTGYYQDKKKTDESFGMPQACSLEPGLYSILRGVCTRLSDTSTLSPYLRLNVMHVLRMPRRLALLRGITEALA